MGFLPKVGCSLALHCTPDTPVLILDSVPPGVAIFIISIATFPTNASPLTITGGTIQGIDFFGAFTSLLSCSLLIFALETGGNSYAWDSWPIISALTISALSLCVFSIWQWLLYKRFADSAILPLFPVHLITDRAIGLTMLYVRS